MTQTRSLPSPCHATLRRIFRQGAWHDSPIESTTQGGEYADFIGQLAFSMPAPTGKTAARDCPLK
jgi:hypothetical protein